MNEVYIVETTNQDGFIYEKYNGKDEGEAKKVYNEFLSRKYNVKTELYKRITIAVEEK